MMEGRRGGNVYIDRAGIFDLLLLAADVGYPGNVRGVVEIHSCTKRLDRCAILLQQAKVAALRL